MTQTLPNRLATLPPSPDWANLTFTKMQQPVIAKVIPGPGVELQTGCNFDIPLHVVIRDVLVHLYSGNGTYQRRVLSMFYHPTMSHYSDMLVAVTGTRALEKLFWLYFGVFVRDVEHSFQHITSSPVHGRMQSPSAVPIPFMKASAREWDGPVWTVSVDHTIRVDLSTLGRLLRLFHILPAYLQIASSPKGLAVTTKLEWIEDPSCSNHSRGTVLVHHDNYAFQTYLDYFVLAPLARFMTFFLKLVGFVLPQLRQIPSSITAVKQLFGVFLLQLCDILAFIVSRHDKEATTAPNSPVNNAMKKRN